MSSTGEREKEKQGPQVICLSPIEMMPIESRTHKAITGHFGKYQVSVNTTNHSIQVTMATRYQKRLLQ